MKIVCVTPTYLRPELLGQMIQCFLDQDYPADLRELVILDDAGQYAPQHGDHWQLISHDERYPSLGAKRNCAVLEAVQAVPDAEAFAIWDDDDLYLPHALSATAWALEKAPLSRPSEVLYERGTRGKRFARFATGGLYPGGWAILLDAFFASGGYSNRLSNGEDRELLGRLEAAGNNSADPCEKFDPFYVYRGRNDLTGAQSYSYHMSAAGIGTAGWRRLGHCRHNGQIARIDVSRPYDLRQVKIESKLHPRHF